MLCFRPLVVDDWSAGPSSVYWYGLDPYFRAQTEKQIALTQVQMTMRHPRLVLRLLLMQL